ncbi:mannitol dehydrogenase family protein [Sphingomonas hylomeconis]|uniref:Mannitol dehydrogenase family protein n=1 Tax=Sphingomonas hylomeconis TaxID=1395958 RepID=A0ABV7SS47_9SPHN|nr:mannitol dehydrogenase family protein [Sphingomonas hylomeconis]
MRLSRANLSALTNNVARPAAQGVTNGRIVHLGIGAFHRAHQAIYTQDGSTPDDGWRITGVSLRSPAVRDALNPQDGLYTVTEQSNGVASTRLVTVIDNVLVAPENPEAVIAVLAAHDTHIVTLTVTEKGYYRDTATGRLLVSDPAIENDVRGNSPQTIYGFLSAALALRRRAGAGGLTLISCDNLSGNGTLLLNLLLEFLDGRDDGLAEWARGHIRAPDTMVDRIVPATTAADRAFVASAIGVEDAGAIMTEPFRQWVIEDSFAGPRPQWENAGAQIVADVAPFELAKLRLLNASHSTLAYAGLQLQYDYVHQAIADPVLRDFVVAQMAEAVPTLIAAPGLDARAYITAILARFANADLHHRLDQIAMDGSQKLPQRWVATVTERFAAGQASPCHLLSVAAWIAYTADAPAIADDPLQARYAAIWAEAAGDVPLAVQRLVGELGLFGPELRQCPAFIATLAGAVAAWQQDGPGVALRAATKADGG